MFSLPKLLLLFGLLWAVWLAFRLIDRRNQTLTTQTRQTDEHSDNSSVDLKECDRCGAFVTAGGGDQADCPLKS